MSGEPNRAHFARQERLRFVESVVLWEGLLQRQRVHRAFGVALNHVTRDLSFYLQQNPDSLDFRPELRGYIAGPRFKPVYASDDPAEYLGLLQARADAGPTLVTSSLGGQDLPMATLPFPAAGIDKGVLREVTHAIAQSTGLKGLYHAMNADKAQERTFWPHALINTGLRWYVRVFDASSQSFRSLVLSRIERPTKVPTSSPVRPALDTAWNTHVVAEVTPHPGLNAHQRDVVAREFGMQRVGRQWVWGVTLRQCMVGAFARRYGLDGPASRAAPVGQWLALRKRSALAEHFWPDGGE